MSKLSQVKGTYDEGREDQFREMMQQLATLEARYKGVRGELLAKVRAEFEKSKPSPTTLSVAKATVAAVPVAKASPAPAAKASPVAAPVAKAAPVAAPAAKASPVAAPVAKAAPVAAPAAKVAPATVAPVNVRAGAPLPSCRACGRSMKLNGTDGTLICQNGHTRLV